MQSESEPIRVLRDGPSALEFGEDTAPPEPHFGVFVGESPAMLGVYRMLAKVARTETTCLITGESGTGKELAAEVIHRLSARSPGSLVAVNCGAIPENLMESEFFGHKKGSFTGAISDHKGRFVLAHQGTLFLDEVGEMEPSMQVKLLRALQQKEVTPVGGIKSERVDVRVVAATNKDLQTEMGSGRFREDLYYRLAVVPVRMPPLRERFGDVPLLIRTIIHRLNQGLDTPIRALTEGTLDALLGWSWPGNVRELSAVLERMAVLADEEILRVGDLPPALRHAAERSPGPEPSPDLLVFSDEVLATLPPVPACLDPRVDPLLPDDGIGLAESVDRFESALILQALERTGWNKNQAARLLQMNRTTLVEKLKKRGLLSPRDEAAD